MRAFIALAALFILLVSIHAQDAESTTTVAPSVTVTQPATKAPSSENANPPNPFGGGSNRDEAPTPKPTGPQIPIFTNPAPRDTTTTSNSSPDVAAQYGIAAVAVYLVIAALV
ncbi:serine/threonine-protein phosphatase 2A regulatory subunit delta [Acrasis kona]|uniref:Serine/threonine-protein phosphatase 2A regulatory subunit delta n=1 Tax=Acrasis kona TaxID=1008807 RepID=A0AAW2Z160_9EUKA